MVFDNYNQEVENKWGNTLEYKEYINKSKNYSKEKIEIINNEMNDIFNKFANYINDNHSISSVEVLRLVKTLQDLITSNFYTCTNEIFLCLGKMYVCDLRFKENIDKFGIGTSNYINEAINYYCNKEEYNE